MAYMPQKIVWHYKSRKYTLLCCITLFFMALGALVGSFEEGVSLVPITVALAVSMGWDGLTGMGMSLLAVGCGFSSGVCNPFTAGVAQKLAGLPLFSGISLRLLTFILIFLVRYAKKIEKPATEQYGSATFCRQPQMEWGLRAFGGTLAGGIALILLSPFLPALQVALMPLIALVFLVAGVLSTKLCGTGWGRLGGTLRDGSISILPAVLLILMASSIKYTLTEAKVLDTVLYRATGLMQRLPTGVAVLFCTSSRW